MIEKEKHFYPLLIVNIFNRKMDRWTLMSQQSSLVNESPASMIKNHPKREIRTGISGIEKKLSQKAKQDHDSISKAFEDLDKLVEMAKPMVKLAQSISAKIRDKEGDISEDETVQFKSYLLSLGVDDPVTKGTCSGSEYFKLLAKEMFLILDEPIQKSGGMMSLTEAFVRVNRARGLELVSPEDILQAAKSMNNSQLPLRLYQFKSGVLVLITTINTEEEIIQDLMNQLESVGSLTPEALSRQMNLSVILARERLLSAESEGLICRDHTIEGLRFYPNKFLVT